MTTTALLLGLLVAALPGVAVGEQVTSAKGEPAIWKALRQGDCAAVGAELNDGLAKMSPTHLAVAGYLFEDGQCVDRDAARARSFSERAVAAGNADVFTEIGLNFATGSGVGQSFPRAAKWLCHADRDMFGSNRSSTWCNDLAADPNGGEARWLGYASSLTLLMSRLAEYPRSAEDAQIESHLVGVICVRPGPPRLTVTRRSAGASMDQPASVDDQRFVRSLQRALDRAVKGLPAPPFELGAQEVCVRRQISFVLR